MGSDLGKGFTVMLLSCDLRMIQPLTFLFCCIQCSELKINWTNMQYTDLRCPDMDLLDQYQFLVTGLTKYPNAFKWRLHKACV